MKAQGFMVIVSVACAAALAGCGGNQGQDDLAGTDLAGTDLAGTDVVADVPDAQNPADAGDRDTTNPFDYGPVDDLCGPDDWWADEGCADQGGQGDTTEPGDHGSGEDLVEPLDSTGTDVIPDAVDTTDPQDTTEPDDVDQPSPHGRVMIAVTKWGTNEYNTTAQGDIGFYDGPMRMDAFAAYTPGRYEAFMRDGACVMYMGTLAACDPVCDWDQYCDPFNKCVDAPEMISGGTVSLMLGATKIDVQPSGEPIANYYYVDSIDAALIHGGNTLIARADGAAGGFGAFELTTTGVDPAVFGVDADGGTLTLVDDKDNIVTWTVPKGDTTGLFVDMVINVGWHGSPPEVVLYCREPASKGSLTITKEMAYGLPTIGGMGLFQHMSHISMNRTVSVEVVGKTVHFTVARRHGLNPLHNQPEW